MISLLLELFNFRFLRAAQSAIFFNSPTLDVESEAETIRYIWSAYLNRSLRGLIGDRSAATIAKAAGSIADPCITLALMLDKPDVVLANLVQCECSAKYDIIQFMAWSSIMIVEALDTNSLCLTVSKALEKSRDIILTKGSVRSLRVIACTMAIRAARVDPVGTKANYFRNDILLG